METTVSEELRTCVRRNQSLIDTLLTRRVQEARRCDLYQRVQQIHDAKRQRVEAATAALQKELLATLEKLYLFDYQRTLKLKDPPGAQLPGNSTAKTFDVAQQLRTSICETQRFNEALRAEILSYDSYCDSLKLAAEAKEVHCCAVQDQLDRERLRRARVVSSSSARSHSEHPSHRSDVRTVAPPATAESSHSFAEALLMDTKQFYQRASGAARDAVVDYIALQDEFYANLCRSPSHSLTATSFEASLLNSVQLFLNTYTQLRRCEQQHYRETLCTITRLLGDLKN